MDGKVIQFNRSIVGSHRAQLLIPDASDLTSKSFESSYFEADFWRDKNAIIGESIGRHTTWFIQAPDNTVSPHWVLRHYYRGGFIAKFNTDKYLYSGLKKTRCYREITLLQQMLALNLPVPKPVAARVIVNKAFYQADLLMEKLIARDLIAHLKDTALSDEHWRAIGKTIADFHNNGIDHADLNAHNILMNEHQKIWLIDFDRCKQRTINKKWQSDNMARLHRSFVKEKKLNKTLNYQNSDWNVLESAYRESLH